MNLGSVLESYLQEDYPGAYGLLDAATMTTDAKAQSGPGKVQPRPKPKCTGLDDVTSAELLTFALPQFKAWYDDHFSQYPNCYQEAVIVFRSKLAAEASGNPRCVSPKVIPTVLDQMGHNIDPRLTICFKNRGQP